MTTHTVGIHGFGTIGRAVAEALLAGEEGVELAAISTRHPREVNQWLDQHGAPRDIVVGTADQAARHAEIVVEASGLGGFADIAAAAARWRRLFVPATVGGLLTHRDILAGVGGVLIPSGAIGGLDIIRAAQVGGGITRLHVETRKPAGALPGGGADTGTGPGTGEAVRLFSGTVADGYREFPANVNVAVACALAGPGPDRTTLEVWRDPTVVRNTHLVTLESPVVSAQIRVQNVPSENPSTGLVTPASILALLRQCAQPLRFL